MLAFRGLCAYLTLAYDNATLQVRYSHISLIASTAGLPEPVLALSTPGLSNSLPATAVLVNNLEGAGQSCLRLGPAYLGGRQAGTSEAF